MIEFLAVIDAGDCGKKLSDELSAEKRYEDGREGLLREVVKIAGGGKEIGNSGVGSPRGQRVGCRIETFELLEHRSDKATHRKQGETIATEEEKRSSK